ncbi:Catalyzes methyl transfer from S-methylmethionine (SMM) to adenosyl-L-homocysteine (AdoMet) [Terramyces sp. JEL0728]|nr:Catalyzes methyl transfer from S-methylmethionine (SMM) to adenosyl-L-homocysteine (AdoMet) [Terramyces sp. JEL0728]
MKMQSQKYHVLDGGFATELEKLSTQSLKTNLWSAQLLHSDPESIRKLHQIYYDSGADIATTCTYQASIQGFKNAGIENPKELIQLAVELAQGKLVAASIGSFGALLANGSEYTGDFGVGLNELIDSHTERVETLLTGQHKPDLILFETIPSLLEIQAIVHVAKSITIPVWLSMQCKENAIAHGESIPDCINLLNQSNIECIGINCLDPLLVTGLLKQIKPITNKRLMCYPNGGGKWDAISKEWIGNEDLECFEDLVREWIRAGATVVGGCCHTGPKHVKVIKKAFNKI